MLCLAALFSTVTASTEGQAQQQQIKQDIALEVRVVDDWTLVLTASWEDGLPKVTAARTQITQPRGYSHSFSSPVTIKDGQAQWTLTFPLADEGAYRPKNRRADWIMGEYRFAVELFSQDKVVGKGGQSMNQKNFMPRQFRGVRELIGKYKYHLVQCAPDRPVYIDEDTVSVRYSTAVDKAKHRTVTMDVVKAGGDKLLAGPWKLNVTEKLSRHTFTSAGWPRGEYWVRLRVHKDGQPVGAYMVRAFWKEILPPEKQPAVRKLERFQPLAGPWGYSRVENIRFDSDPMKPRPDRWIVSQQKPWESEFLWLKSQSVRYDNKTGQYSLDIGVSNINPRRPVKPTVCRIVSKDGVNWRRPNLGRIEYEGSKDNNIISYQGVDVQGNPTWPIASFHESRVKDNPDLVPNLEKLSIRFYNPEQDGKVNPKNCFLKNLKWDLLVSVRQIHTCQVV